jgi:hypothetical protein
MFTLPELIEYFEGQYTEVQVIEALNKIQASPDQNGVYPNAVVQGLEAAFNISQEAARKLPGGNVRDAQNLAIELAQDRAIELDLDANTLTNVVELIVSEGMAEAVFKHQLKQQVMEKVTADLESQSLMGLTDRNAQKIATIATILSDPDNLDKIIQDFGGTSQEQVVQLQQTLAADSTFDVEAFFTEVESEKKPTQIQVSSVQDVKKLSSALMQRYRKNSTKLNS